MPKTRADITDVRATDSGYSITVAANNTVLGSFVDLSKLDTTAYMRNPVVLWSHAMYDPPIGRTTALRRDYNGVIDVDFEFIPGDERSQKFKNLWDRGFLRAASISWRTADNGQDELLEWSLVSIPADRDAVRFLIECEDDEPAAAAGTTEAEMDEEQVREMIATALEEQTASLTAQIAALLESQREQEPVVERTAPTGTDENAIRAAAAARVGLLQRAGPLLGQVDTTTLTDREVLLAAIGDDLPDAAQRSTDYLHATLDNIIARRNAAAEQKTAETSATPMFSARAGAYSNGAMIRQMAREDK